jgi:hypothetical protein
VHNLITEINNPLPEVYPDEKLGIRCQLMAGSGKAVCLWCVGKAAVRKNANLSKKAGSHALKHAL